MVRFSLPVCDRGAYGGIGYSGPHLYVPCREGLVALYLQSSSAVAASAGSNNTANVSGSNAYSAFTVKWRGPSFQAGPRIVANGLVWTVDIKDGQLYAFNQSTGEIKFQEDLGDVVHFTTPSSSHGQIFVAASNNVLSFSIK